MPKFRAGSYAPERDAVVLNDEIATTFSVHGKTFATKDEAIAHKIKTDRKNTATDYLETTMTRYDRRRGPFPCDVVELCSDNLDAIQHVLEILSGKPANLERQGN